MNVASYCCGTVCVSHSHWVLAYLLRFMQVKGDCLSLQWMEDLCKLHCLSVVFLLHLPLSQRACTRIITSDWIEDIQTFLKMVNMFFANLLFTFCFNCFIYIEPQSSAKIDLYENHVSPLRALKVKWPKSNHFLIPSTLFGSNNRQHSVY